MIKLAGDGNSNHGKPNFLEVVTEALRRHWRVTLISRKNVNKAYKRLQNDYKDLFRIQYIYPADLVRARVMPASLPLQRRPLTPAHQPSPSEMSPPPAPALTAEELRAARLKFFCQQQSSASANAPDASNPNAMVDGTAHKRALCFEGECVNASLSAFCFLLHRSS